MGHLLYYRDLQIFASEVLCDSCRLAPPFAFLSSAQLDVGTHRNHGNKPLKVPALKKAKNALRPTLNACPNTIYETDDRKTFFLPSSVLLCSVWKAFRPRESTKNSVN